jgi:hypothetical protein
VRGASMSTPSSARGRGARTAHRGAGRRDRGTDGRFEADSVNERVRRAAARAGRDRAQALRHAGDDKSRGQARRSHERADGESEGGNPLRRIMLALDALNCETALIEAAALIAAKLEAELDALFVEDDDVYAGGGPADHAGDLARSSAREREITASRVEQALRCLSREAERALQRRRRSAAASRVEFQVTRARRGEAIGAAALGTRRAAAAAAAQAHPRARARAATTRPPRVFVLCGQPRRPVAARSSSVHGSRSEDHHVLEVIVAGEKSTPRCVASSGRSGLIVVNP